MQTFNYTLSGQECAIFVPERRSDLAGFERFLGRGDKVLGLDTETTGLDVYAPGFGCRTVQFGNRTESWVLRVDAFADEIVRALRQPRGFAIHNAAFDLQVIERTLGVRMEDLADSVIDTRILAHLLDPRTRHEGGAGLSLKELCEIYVDPSAPDTQKDLHAVFRSLGFTKRTGWAEIDIMHPTYLLYAGLDPILAYRLFRALGPMVKEIGLSHLSQFEHRLQVLTTMMERKGMRLDLDYVETLRADLEAERVHYSAVAARYGVESVGSPAQVATALVAMGETLTERTDSGALKVDAGVLLPLADLTKQWDRIDAREPNPLADAVLRAKRAGKWQTSYVDAFAEKRDSAGRIHPKISSLAARTARMSVSDPPLQQLPSGDWRIRRAIIADPGMLIVSADYAQVEMRVLAALSGDTGLTEAILAGTDLHDFTASRVFGSDFTPAQRKVSKAIGFGKVYGGGLTTICRQTGAPAEEVSGALAAFDREFPGIKRYSARLARRAEYGKREVVTVTGRHLPLDRDRIYAATNYVVQSTARDLLAQAIVDLHDAGLGDYLLLPIHDEVLAQAPREDAEDVVREMARIMGSTFYGIPIKADPDVYGPSWGSGYKVPPGRDFIGD